MPITPKHRTVESRFRQLLADASLPEPDAVEYEPEAVVFFWHEPKTAIAVDFDGLADDEPPQSSSGSSSRASTPAST